MVVISVACAGGLPPRSRLSIGGGGDPAPASLLSYKAPLPAALVQREGLGAPAEGMNPKSYPDPGMPAPPAAGAPQRPGSGGAEAPNPRSLPGPPLPLSALAPPFAQRLAGAGLSWSEAVGESEGGQGLRGEAQADGIEGLTDGATKLRFGRDLRLVEARRPSLTTSIIAPRCEGRAPPPLPSSLLAYAEIISCGWHRCARCWAARRRRRCAWRPRRRRATRSWRPRSRRASWPSARAPWRCRWAAARLR